MRRASLTLFLLLLIPATAHAKDAAIERGIERQDKLDWAKEGEKHLAEAQAAVTKADTAANRFLLGRAHMLLARFDEARKQFERALEKDGTCAYAYVGLGACHAREGNQEEGERQFRNAVKLDPALSYARLELAGLFLRQNRFAAATKELLAILKKEPGHERARHLLADIYLGTKEYKKAVQEYRILVKRQPKHRDLKKKLCLALLRVGKFDEAIAIAKGLVKSDPKDADAYTLLASIYMEKGDEESAIETLERLVNVLPEDDPRRGEVEAEIRDIRRGKYRDQRVTYESLKKDLESEDVEVRRRAMRTLSEIEFVPPLTAMLRRLRDPDLLMRVLTVRYLGRIRWRGGVVFLEMLLHHPRDRDESEEVRGAAVHALERQWTPAVVPVLLETLSDESHYVFGLTVKALRTLSGKCFTEDVSRPVGPSERKALTAKWWAFWESPRALSMKLEAIRDIEEFGSLQFAHYLLPLLADGSRKVAERARKAFFDLTGVLPGEDGDLDTMEGRLRIQTAAARALEKPNAVEKPKSGEEPKTGQEPKAGEEPK